MTAHFVDSVLNKASTTKVLQFHIGNTGYRIDYSGRGNIFLCVWWKVDFLKITLSQFPTLCADVETHIRTVVVFCWTFNWSCGYSTISSKAANIPQWPAWWDMVLKSHHLSPPVTSCLDFFPSTILSGSPCYSGRLVNTNPWLNAIWLNCHQFVFKLVFVIPYVNHLGLTPPHPPPIALRLAIHYILKLTNINHNWFGGGGGGGNKYCT